MIDNNVFADGGCPCGSVTYTLLVAPMFVHCCHCTWCQRETGSAFAINALIESRQIDLHDGQLESVDMPTSTGHVQQIVRCSSCKTAVWSHYAAARDRVAFVKVGTLKDPNLCPPDIHIFTSTRQQWVDLNEGVPAVEEFYRRSEYWPADSVARYRSAVPKD